MERVSVSKMDDILGKAFNVLDKGFVRVVDYMGSDSAIVQAARVSYGDGTKTVNQDKALINYLVRHRHTSPLEMCELKLHLKMPIFIARQWIRHRTASLNELSGRYSVMPQEFFVPELEEISEQSKGNMQGRDKKILDGKSRGIINDYTDVCDNAFSKYNSFLDESNLARELSRGVLPLSAYTELYWKIDLHNLLHFVRLRAKKGAQKEIRDYAEIILHKIIKIWTPFVYDAFMDYQFDSVTLSKKQFETLSSMLDKDAVNHYIEKNIENKTGDVKEFISTLKALLPTK